MKSIFKAEIANLQRLVASAAHDREFSANDRERTRTHAGTRVKHLHAALGRMAKENRAAVLACVKKFGSQKSPISANRVAEMVGMKDDTTRRHLRELAETGTLVAVVSASGRVVRYYVGRVGNARSDCA